MPIYNYEFDDGVVADGKKLVSTMFDHMNGDQIERQPAIAQLAAEELKRTTILFDSQNLDRSEEIRMILPQGLRTMDRGLKNYFSGIRVPTKDGLKLMQVRISGGDKPYLIWSQDLVRGRVSLPVMAIKREGDEEFLENFSPAHVHYMNKRFVDQDMTKIALTYRPIPLKINYTLSVWAEFKRDLEYILYQVRTRFNPIAQYYVEDEHQRSAIILHYNGMSDAVDDEVPPEQRANKRYDFNIQMEGYLPLPEKIVSSILGKVVTMRDGSETAYNYGEILQTMEGKLNAYNINLTK